MNRYVLLKAIQEQAKVTCADILADVPGLGDLDPPKNKTARFMSEAKIQR